MTSHSGFSAFWVQPNMAAPLPKCWSSSSREKFSVPGAVFVEAVEPNRLPGPAACRRPQRDPRYGRTGPCVGVAVAESPCEDGPRLLLLPIAKSRGERSRTFPCRHTPPVHFDGFSLLYRLWTLPYTFLTRIICATVSVIVRRRRAASPTRVDHPAAPTRSASATAPRLALHTSCSVAICTERVKTRSLTAERRRWESVWRRAAVQFAG